MRERRLCVNFFRQGEAVHFRHHGIEKHDFVGGIRVGRARHLLESAGARFDRGGFHPPIQQHGAEHAAIDRVIVHHECTQTLKIWQLRVLRWRKRRAHAEARGEMKGGSYAHFAFDPDSALHFLDEL